MKPEVKVSAVALFISKDSTDFPRTHGAKVKAAGGRYSDIRGNGASHRYVHLPLSERELVDEIMELYGSGPKRQIQVKAVESEVLGRDRCFQVLNQNGFHTVFDWDYKNGTKPSDFIEEAFQKQLSAFNWQPVMTRWAQEDQHAVDRRLTAERNERIANLREMIALESVRILDGANDIEPLKDLAAQYRIACADAGIVLDALEDQDKPTALKNGP